MIGALATAGAAFEEPRYVQAAEKAARFVLGTLRRKDGRLLRRYRDGEAAIPAFLDDYAFLADALFDLHQATFRPEYLEECLRITDAMVTLFGDPKGGFFLTASDHEELIVRTRDVYDGAMPSGVSTAVHALLKVAELTSNEKRRETAKAALSRHAAELMGFPQGHPHLASAADRALSPGRQIVIAGDSPEMLRVIRRLYLPNTGVAVVPAAGPESSLVRQLPGVEGKKAVGGKPSAYVCENYTCQAPVTSPDDLAKLLAK
jgi:uncharacterized protein YyaL (SSP411 family)